MLQADYPFSFAKHCLYFGYKIKELLKGFVFIWKIVNLFGCVFPLQLTNFNLSVGVRKTHTHTHSHITMIHMSMKRSFCPPKNAFTMN